MIITIRRRCCEGIMKKNKSLKTKKNNKSKFSTVQDDRIVRIYLILFCLGFAGVFLVYYFIKHDLPASEFVVVMTTFDEYTFFVYLMIVLLIWEIFLLKRYKKKCSRIMQNGTSCIGNVLEAVRVPTSLKGHGVATNWWQYKIKLPDGTTVTTEQYSHNFMRELNWRRCTVYELDGEYYFTDFK